MAVFVTISRLTSSAAAADAPEAAAPADQEYIGAKRCASCHFEQYMSWKKTAHAKAFVVLTAKYQEDPKCLKCHTTGYGKATGYKDWDTTSSLASVTCETCHGPGSKHEEIAQPVAQVKDLTPEQEKVLRDSIWRMIPQNICVDCHKVQAHEKSSTPKELQGS